MKEEFKIELVDNILPYWMNRMQDDDNGGFYGQIDGYDRVQLNANKGAILNARILWTFSAAYRILNKDEYRQIAQRAFNYIETYFIDKEHGGAYWELDYKGNPVNMKKQVYAQGFMLYGFSEFYRATGNPKALHLAKEFFRIIEDHKDKVYGGYPEAFTCDWQPIEDMRLSEKDANEKKTMNTHLHILEPYTNLLRIWREKEVIDAQKQLLTIFTEKILNQETNHLNLFFDETWTPKSSAISYGHDIEASWLLREAAEVLQDENLIKEINSISLGIASAAVEGLDSDGTLSYKKEGNKVDKEKHWWVQAEAVVGFYDAYCKSSNTEYLEISRQVWKYIQDNIIDTDNGEWYWSTFPDGTINREEDKAGFWKCPYHNSRMCMKMMEGIELQLI